MGTKQMKYWLYLIAKLGVAICLLYALQSALEYV